jgi:ankyrin repeat protein
MFNASWSSREAKPSGPTARRRSGAVDVDPRQWDDADVTDFLDAVKSGDLDAVTAALQQNPELTRFAGDYAKTGLHWAAEFDRVEVARALLDAGADIEAVTSWAATPLEWAATMGSRRVGDLLLSRGARGLSLVVAAGLGMLDEVRARVEAGLDLGSDERHGAYRAADDEWPPDTAHRLGDGVSHALYAAARNGHTPVVEYLLQRGANVDAKGFFGGTALHWAAINGHRSTVELLLAWGARRDIRDARFDGIPSDWAVEGGHEALAERLGPSHHA